MNYCIFNYKGNSTDKFRTFCYVKFCKFDLIIM